MKKRILSLGLVLALAVSLLAACGAPAPAASTPAAASSTAAPAAEPVELTLGSWRTDDVAQMEKLLAAYKEVAPNVTITFQPTNPPDYNATLRLQLDGGTGPDLMYARSYATGEELFDTGYFADCSDIPGLKDNFVASSLAPWQTKD
ncbi:MAG: extracellular solute-binding protein, partial [Ruthenibacterium sp.]